MIHTPPRPSRVHKTSPAWPGTALVFLVLLLPASLLCAAGLEEDVFAAIRSAKLGKTRYSIAIEDVSSGRTILRVNADQPMIPASNMKLVTTASALGILGPDFSFRTQLYLRQTTPEGAILVIQGDGDPAFCDPKLLEANQLDVEQAAAAWIKAIRGAGISRVAQVLIDDRVFEPQFIHPDWPPGQLNSWYCAQVTGLNFNDNCLDIYPVPTRPGQPPQVVFSPEAPFLTLINRAVTGSNDNFLISRKNDSNDMVCSGSVRTRAVNPISVTLNDPPMFFARYFAHKLQAAGIPVDSIGRVAAGDQPGLGQPLPDLQRTVLSVILQRCNKDSQNLFAESLLKRIGRTATGQPGSWENGAAAARTFLARKIGTHASAIIISDGSGMSRDNRVSAAALVELLSAMASDPKLGPAYTKSLSIAGQDGTLHKRLENNLTGRVIGKTGYIAGVSSFSGYLILPASASLTSSTTDPSSAKRSSSEQWFAFSFLFNEIDPHVSVHDVKAFQDKLVRILDAHSTR